MDRPELLAITIGFMVVVLLLLPLGWWLRKRRQRDVAAPLGAPDDIGESFGTFSGKYVATTKAGDPLDRIAVHGLGFRGPVDVTVASNGILLQVIGSSDTWIPLADLADARRATWTIDRVVEKDGMNLLAWSLDGLALETYLRMDDPAAFDAALDALIPTVQTPEGHTS